MRWRIEWSTRADKDLGALDGAVRRRIIAAVERVATGEGDVRRLTDVDPPLFRLRVGDWRVMFRYDDAVVTFK
jgi:mRNA-degrading endonuclease RelE of RelBE toxin-antitoxin system